MKGLCSVLAALLLLGCEAPTVPPPTAVSPAPADAEAASYHVPTAREVAIAMRDDGRTFVAKLPTARKICHACGGTGKAPAEAAQAAGEAEGKAARQSREANGRENFLYGPSLTEQLEAKRERQQRALPQPCPKCGGSGGFAVEEFRRLIFKKQ